MNKAAFSEDPLLDISRFPTLTPRELKDLNTNHLHRRWLGHFLCFRLFWETFNRVTIFYKRADMLQKRNPKRSEAQTVHGRKWHRLGAWGGFACVVMCEPGEIKKWTS